MYQPQQFSILPPAVKNLLIINIILFIACIVFQNTIKLDLSDYLALHTLKSPNFNWWQFITYQFMHGDAGAANVDFQSSLMHIFSNMFALYMFGSVLENYWGWQKFICFYLLCGVVAAICHLLVLNYQHSVLIDAYQSFVANPTWAQYKGVIAKNNFHLYNTQGTDVIQQHLTDWANAPQSTEFATLGDRLLHTYIYGVADAQGFKGIIGEKTVGASGAVFGILGAFAFLFPNNYIYLYFAIPVKVKYAIAGYALFEFIGAFRFVKGDNIAHVAHLAGLAAGLVIVFIWQRRPQSRF
jgi:membrane associated rhomboid family serine protease